MAGEQDKKRTVVSIYGQQYTIVGRETSQHVKAVANLVDNKMKEINKLNPYLDTTKLAVLTAVNIVDEYIKLKEKVKQLEKLQEKEEE
ncbi:cell division protein ZapA [Anaerobacillus sp. MEB173]|uniref:cell division protein ZapA n=1 Tax=Anaerobacillus sp. MEB173 TaxID=3383345 RepID=UPI003F8E9E88